MKLDSRIYSMVDLFAGCGGLSLGFEKADFTSIFVNEINEDALNTYLINRKHVLGGLKFSENKSLHCYDIYDLDGDRLDQLTSDFSNISEIDFYFEDGVGSTLDMLVGGPPCQGYSGIGIRRSYDVDRKQIPSNFLYKHMIYVINMLKPRIFLFENVPGLLTAKWTDKEDDLIWPEVRNEFKNILEYEVRWSLIHSRDYGVPQNRPRVLLVGIRKDVVANSNILQSDADYNDAIKCNFIPYECDTNFLHPFYLLGDLVDHKVSDVLRAQSFKAGKFETVIYPHPPLNKVQEYFRSPPYWDSKHCVNLTEQEYSKHKQKTVNKFDSMFTHNGKILKKYKTKKFSQRLLPYKWGKDGPNITITSLPDDYVHYCQPRTLTVRECARFQFFPDWYRFIGKRTTGGLRRAGNPIDGLYVREVPKYTQIANAVPVKLAEKIANHFKFILDDVFN